MARNRNIDRELERLLGEFDAMLERAQNDDRKNHDEISSNPPLTKAQLKAFVREETNFTKRIVTPLDKNSRQTRRYQSLMIPLG